MRLHSLTLRDYRGIAEAVIEPAPRGLTLIEGPNEIGKSSLSEALDLLLGEKDSTRKKSVLAIQPVGRDVGPFVEAEMEVGPARFRYAKQYIKGKRTELTILSPRAEQLRGDEAHDRVTALLDSHTDLALWRALRMEQAGSLRDPVDFEAQTALSDALDRAAGTAIKAGTTEQESIYEAAREETRKYFTPTLKPGKETTALEEHVRELSEELKALKDREGELEKDVARIQRLEEALAQSQSRQPELDQAARDLEALDRRMHQAAAVLARARSERDAARAQFDDCQRRQARHASVADDRSRVQRELSALQESVAGSDRTRAALAAAELSARDALVSGEREAAQARLADDALRDAQSATRARAERDDLAARASRLQAADRQLREAKKQLSEARVTRSALDEAVVASAELKAADQRLLEAAPALELDALADIELRHGDTTESMPRGASLSLRTAPDQPIEIARVARLRVVGGSDRAALKDGHRKAAERFEALLASMGVDSLSAAQTALTDRERLEALVKTQPGEIRRILGDDTPEALRDRLSALNERLAQRPDQPPAGEQPPGPVSDDEAATATRKARIAAEETLAAARRAHGSAAAQLQEHDRETEKLKTHLEIKQAESERLGRAFAELGGEAAAATLAAESGRAGELLSRCDAAVETARHALGPSDPEAMAAQLESARSAAQVARDAMSETDRELATARGRLTVASETGLYEQIAHTAGELEQADGRLRALRRRAAAARLLFETLQAARDAQRESYVAPMKQALEQLGRVVYGPDFAVEMNADLAVVSRTLDGSTVPFADLSTGAREQLAVLIRLAAARVVDPDDGVPLILDDVLGHSDPERLRSMNAVLQLAGDHCQIIVLTCFPERYLHARRAKTIRLG